MRPLKLACSVLGVGTLASILLAACGPLEPPLRLAQARANDPGSVTAEASSPTEAMVRPDRAPAPSSRKGRASSRQPPVKISPEVLRRAESLQPLVRQAARRFGLEVNLLNAIIWHESRFNPSARNRSGAKGLMQLMPKTSKAMARRLERRNRPLDPEFSIEAGAQLLAILGERYSGNRDLTLFAYARGGGRVRAWRKQGGPMPEGVRRYISKVAAVEHSFEVLGFR